MTLAALLASLAAPVGTSAAPAAAQVQAVRFSVETTDLGTLLDSPAAKAVLQKYIADLINNEQIKMARPMTLKQLQQYDGEALTDAKLAAIQADFDKLPNQ